MSDDLKSDLAEAIRYALSLKTHFIRKAKLTEDQMRMDANQIAEHLVLANFKKGEPAKPSGWREQEPAAQELDLTTVMGDLYVAEINASVSWFYDAGFTVSIGDDMNGWKAHEVFQTLPEVAAWLRDTAIELYPGSSFAGIYRGG